jgi:hypothetical protein
MKKAKTLCAEGDCAELVDLVGERCLEHRIVRTSNTALDEAERLLILANEQIARATGNREMPQSEAILGVGGEVGELSDRVFEIRKELVE